MYFPPNPRDPRVMIQRLMLADPSLSAADLQAALKRKGCKLSSLTVSTIREDFRETLKVLQHEGLLKRPIELRKKVLPPPDPEPSRETPQPRRKPKRLRPWWNDRE